MTKQGTGSTGRIAEPSGDEIGKQIIVDDSQRAREAVRQRKLFEFLAIAEAQVDEYIALGWETEKKLKSKIRVRKPKPFDEQLENKLWLLLYKLGYPELNRGRKFKIDIKRRGADPLTKQVDVFAKDDETVVVAECKASERVTKNRSLQKDLEEFGNLKGPIAEAVHAHYGTSFKPKIIWLFVTENIIWSKPDRERAAGQNI